MAVRSGVRMYSKQASALKYRIKLKYVPKSNEPSEIAVKSLQQFIDRYSKLTVITGAGISTESGIPDYRSEGVGLYARKNYKPLQYQEFLKSADLRQRYWARSYVGWPLYSNIKPSQNHFILNDWENKGKIHWLITQNVDHLHIKAGSRRVTELHGTLYQVGCLSCGHTIPRQAYQTQIEEYNPKWTVQSFEIATDGDVFLTEKQIEGFKVPPCQKCGGNMKPKIVFFGDNVPRPIVAALYDRVKEADAVIVFGSSLQVYSAYRFILAASEASKPIAIVNIGSTRGDHLCSFKLEAKCGDILPLMNVGSES